MTRLTNPLIAERLAPTPEAPSTVQRLTLRMDDFPKLLGVSRRAIERERAAGRFPKPDLTIGKMPLWRVETINTWLGRGGQG